MRALELKVPPLVVLLFVGAIMWLGARVAPTLAFQLPARLVVALGLASAGACTAIAGVTSFRLARTTVNPLKPETASTLVVSGIYRLTRNPMYLGILLLLIAWAVFLANPVAFFLVPTFVIYMNRFQIAPEEKALAARFGSEFAIYCAKVRRWL